ncbi:hypothetical protein BVI434_1710023 [Burkholderia vietnamiensis]|nr:hypothetical protein BVI434_1710023 [Burkholderia vietnamiensis]
MRRLQHAAVRVRRQVPFGLRLAELLQAAERRGDRREDRPLARDGARRGALQPLRRASRPRVRGRPARPDRFALLHQFGCVKLRVPTRKRMSVTARIDRHSVARCAAPGGSATRVPTTVKGRSTRPFTQLRAP